MSATRRAWRVHVGHHEHDLGGWPRRHGSAGQPRRAARFVERQPRLPGGELRITGILELERDADDVSVERDRHREVGDVEDDVSEAVHSCRLGQAGRGHLGREIGRSAARSARRRSGRHDASSRRRPTQAAWHAPRGQARTDPPPTTCPARPHEPSPPCSPCAITSSHRSSPASADPPPRPPKTRPHRTHSHRPRLRATPRWDANPVPRSGHGRGSVTTRCRSCFASL